MLDGNFYRARAETVLASANRALTKDARVALMFCHASYLHIAAMVDRRASLNEREHNDIAVLTGEITRLSKSLLK